MPHDVLFFALANPQSEPTTAEPHGPEMPYVPGYDHDVFVSYAHVDDQPLSSEEKGWVARLHEELRVSLARMLGRAETLSIWRDPKLAGNDYFDDTIDQAFARSALFVCILSPGYVASTYCLKELSGYCQAHGGNAGVRVGGKSRLFKVLLSQTDEEPEPLRGLGGYRFFALDPTTTREEPFRRTRESDPDQRYWTTLRDLAAEIAQMLDRMRQVAEHQAPPPQPSGPAVYLAEVTDDLEDARDEVRRALEQRGVRVLPDQPLPWEADAMRDQVRADLERAELAVHLFGPLYGRKVRGGTRSLPHLQYLYASQCPPDDPPRLVWVPRELDSDRLRDASQQALVAGLETGAGPAPEILRTGLEELKETLLDRLFPPEAAPGVLPPGALVYITCTPEDATHAATLRSLLSAANHDVILPARGGDQAALEQHHLTNLQYCDALVILYGQAPLVWVRERALQARQLAARRKLAPHVVMSVLDGPPPDKEDLGIDFRNLLVVNCRSGFAPERVKDLLGRLAAARS